MNVSGFENQVLRERASLGRGRPEISDEHFESVDHVETEDLPYIFARAVMHGDVELASFIWRRRGPFKATIQIPPGPTTRYEIVGAEKTVPLPIGGYPTGVGRGHYFSMLQTADQAEELFELMIESGLLGDDGFSDALSLLLDPDRLENTSTHFKSLSPHCVEEDLPFLRAGVLENPELVIGMKELAESRSFARAYEQVLVWASPDMINDFPNHLRPYRASQKVNYTQPQSEDPNLSSFQKEMSQYVSARLDEFASDQLHRFDAKREAGTWVFNEDPSKPLRFKSLECGVEPSNRLDVQDCLLLECLASKAIRRGFGFNQGRVLCAASTEFLSNFPSTAPRESKLHAILRALRDYCPMAMIHFHYGQGREANACLISSEKETFLGNSLVSRSGRNSDFAARLKQYLHPELLRVIVQDTYGSNTIRQKVGVDDFIGLKALGFSDAPMWVKVSGPVVSELAMRGLKIPEGSVLEATPLPLDQYTLIEWCLASQEYYGRVLSVAAGRIGINGIWSDSKTKELLKETRRFKSLDVSKADVQIRVAMLRRRGVDALMPDVKTASDWRLMFKVFGHEPMSEYMHKAPDEVMTQEMSGVLGL